MNLPVEFVEFAAEALGSERAEELCSAIVNTEQSVAVRFNPCKSAALNWHRCHDESNSESCCENSSGDYINFEGGRDIIGSSVPWRNDAYYLNERPIFTLDPLFHAGAYYVQDSSSMYMKIALEASGMGTPESLHNLMVLDLCAAPGGKSTDLLSFLPDDSLLVSNEVIGSRATVLAENIVKWGRNNVVVTNSDPSKFTNLNHFFDIVVVDAPCSGEGMFRKDPKAVEEWSVANVKLSAERQRRILSDVWPALKPGGILIYSTCTFNSYENDNNIAFLESEFGARIIGLNAAVNAFPKLFLTRKGGVQFIPGLVDGEGQYLAVVRKSCDTCFTPDKIAASASFCNDYSESIGNSSGKKFSKKNGKESSKNCSRSVAKIPDFLSEIADGYDIVTKGDLIKFIPSIHAKAINFLERNLKVILSGRVVANSLGAPDPDLAFDINSSLINLPKVNLTRDEALKFLAREPLVFNNYPKGYLFLTYCGLGLGFVKNLGSRSNSLMPNGRRIRMDISLSQKRGWLKVK